VPWLAPADLQADALSDLATKGNKLSVFLIADKDDSLTRVVAALAANSQVIWDFEYALFDEAALSQINISMEVTEGDTPDSLVNTWHRDLIELTAAKSMKLASIVREQAERSFILSKQVRALVAEALMSNKLDRTRLKLNDEEKRKIELLIYAR
jgi:hypothetical protein